MPNEVDLEGILAQLGYFGKYQIKNYLLLLLPIVFSAIYGSQYIFAAAEINFRCNVPQCESTPLVYDASSWAHLALPQGGSRCQQYLPLDNDTCTSASFNLSQNMRCQALVYETQTHSIVSEFNFGCDSWKRTLVGSIHNFGLLVALPITAFISDIFGRRPALILTAVSAGIFGLIRSFSTNYIMYLSFEFLDATFGSGVYSTGFILGLEMIGQKWRVVGGNFISITFAIGQVILAIIAWSIQDWRSIHRVIYAPSLLFVFYFFMIEESVRWLLSKGKKEEAARVIFKAAEMNKKKLSADVIQQLSTETAPDVKIEKEIPKENQPSLCKQVLKSKIMIKRLLICSFWWITATFTYYGLSINSVSLAGNSYMNFILTSLVEIPGYCISMFTLDRFGRKISMIIAWFLCGMSLFSLPFVLHIPWLTTTLYMAGKLCISMIFTSIYIYTSELFPTAARHSLLGFCSMVGRIGSILAPQTPLLMIYMESLPYILFGSMTFISGFLMLLTPETLNCKLPDTIDEAEKMNQDITGITKKNNK